MLFIGLMTWTFLAYCQLKYPDIKKVIQTYDCFDTKVSDPYRWFEDDKSVMTLRLYLFKVAIPQLDVMDMLRYHNFTIGWGWATEYLRSDKEDDFKNLIKFLHLHNLKKGIKYSATLITPLVC